MTRLISQEEFLADPADKLAAAQVDSFMIDHDGKLVAALVSPEDYEIIRVERGRRAMAALDTLSSYIESVTDYEERVELEKALDRHAT